MIQSDHMIVSYTSWIMYAPFLAFAYSILLPGNHNPGLHYKRIVAVYHNPGVVLQKNCSIYKMPLKSTCVGCCVLIKGNSSFGLVHRNKSRRPIPY